MVGSHRAWAAGHLILATDPWGFLSTSAVPAGLENRDGATLASIHGRTPLPFCRPPTPGTSPAATSRFNPRHVTGMKELRSAATGWPPPPSWSFDPRPTPCACYLNEVSTRTTFVSSSPCCHKTRRARGFDPRTSTRVRHEQRLASTHVVTIAGCRIRRWRVGSPRQRRRFNSRASGVAPALVRASTHERSPNESPRAIHPRTAVFNPRSSPPSPPRASTRERNSEARPSAFVIPPWDPMVKTLEWWSLTCRRLTCPASTREHRRPCEVLHGDRPDVPARASTREQATRRWKRSRPRASRPSCFNPRAPRRPLEAGRSDSTPSPHPARFNPRAPRGPLEAVTDWTKASALLLQPASTP
jgi:hypothetical protein